MRRSGGSKGAGRRATADADVLARPWQGCGEDSGLVSGHAPAEAALDRVEVFLFFVPFAREKLRVTRLQGYKVELKIKIRESGLEVEGRG
jgi:hypothetical protein